MRRLANWVLAIISALLAFANAPLWGKVDGGWSYSGPIFIFLSPILLALITTIVGAFRAVSVATQRRELATQMASGLTRGRAVRGAARDGLRVGLLWGGAGIAVGALARQIVTGLSGTAFDANSAVELVSVFIVAVLSAVLSWTVVTALATRGTVGSAASASVDAPMADVQLRRAAMEGIA